jgi:hypothetical protein
LFGIPVLLNGSLVFDAGHLSEVHPACYQQVAGGAVQL